MQLLWMVVGSRQSKDSKVCSPLSGLYSVAPLYLFLLALLIQKEIPTVNPGGLLGAALSSINDHQGKHREAATRKREGGAQGVGKPGCARAQDFNGLEKYRMKRTLHRARKKNSFD
jgi:hypothetical protein